MTVAAPLSGQVKIFEVVSEAFSLEKVILSCLSCWMLFFCGDVCPMAGLLFDVSYTKQIEFFTVESAKQMSCRCVCLKREIREEK